MNGETIEMVTGPEAGDADADALTPADKAKPAEGAEVDDDGAGADKDKDKNDDPDAKLKEKLTPEAQKAFDKRIAREVGKTRAAQAKADAAEAELAGLRKRADAEDGEAVIAAAREAGVMPEIVSAAEAKGLAELKHAKANAKALGRVLRSNAEAEVEIDGKVYTRKQVVDAQESWEDKAEALEKRFGGVESKAREKGLEIWRLGLAAQREGWKPGGKPAKAADPDEPDEQDDTDEPDTPAPKAKPKTDIPGGGGTKARPDGKPAAPDVEVHDERSLAAFIDADTRARKKK